MHWRAAQVKGIINAEINDDWRHGGISFGAFIENSTVNVDDKTVYGSINFFKSTLTEIPIFS